GKTAVREGGGRHAGKADTTAPGGGPDICQVSLCKPIPVNGFSLPPGWEGVKARPWPWQCVRARSESLPG
ncbi:MAG: hypothetical protein OXH76_03485, partial [Boseongicola sp.]|nr:hypothetical protein [Boseongicola sp.]